MGRRVFGDYVTTLRFRKSYNFGWVSHRIVWERRKKNFNRWVKQFFYSPIPPVWLHLPYRFSYCLLDFTARVIRGFQLSRRARRRSSGRVGACWRSQLPDQKFILIPEWRFTYYRWSDRKCHKRASRNPIHCEHFHRWWNAVGIWIREYVCCRASDRLSITNQIVRNE